MNSSMMCQKADIVDKVVFSDKRIFIVVHWTHRIADNASLKGWHLRSIRSFLRWVHCWLI